MTGCCSALWLLTAVAWTTVCILARLWLGCERSVLWCTIYGSTLIGLSLRHSCALAAALSRSGLLSWLSGLRPGVSFVLIGLLLLATSLSLVGRGALLLLFGLLRPLLSSLRPFLVLLARLAFIALGLLRAIAAALVFVFGFATAPVVLHHLNVFRSFVFFEI